MTLTFRTRRRLKGLFIALLSLTMAFILAWLGWVVYLERYIIYTRDGVVLNLDLDLDQYDEGVVATPPDANETVPIFYNEGSNAQEMNAELTQLWGYYISFDDLAKDINACRDQLALLPAGTPVMIELKSGYGKFHYSTSVPGAELSDSVNIAEVDSLIQDLRSRNLYLIAKVSAFRDRAYGLKNVPQGIYHVNKKGLWPDNNNCYWLNPTNPTVLSYISSIVQELKEMDFDEVLLADFSVPVSDKVYFKEDRTEALKNAANTIIESCGSEYFTISFGVTSSTFPLPEGRTRMYLSGVEAQNVGAVIAQSKVENAEIRIVFLADTNDTRYDEYGVLRPLSASEVLN
ncbi:MAG: putative glycoside hydrolase [Oscillospiraceae bacterium]|nr:putative glycoside hydrolase [Oscillospiraceae bacterium]